MTRVRKQPIIALYFEFVTVLKFYNLEARGPSYTQVCRFVLGTVLSKCIVKKFEPNDRTGQDYSIKYFECIFTSSP